MIKITESAIHDFPVIVFFKGSRPAKQKAQYLFEESEMLFSQQNVASILVEFSGSGDELKEFVNSKTFQALFERLKDQHHKKVTVLEVSLSQDIGADVELQNFENGLSPITLQATEITFSNVLGFSLRSSSHARDPRFFSAQFRHGGHFARLIISRKFYNSHNRKLSDRFAHAHHGRNDLQVLFAMFIPCLAGTATDL